MSKISGERTTVGLIRWTARLLSIISTTLLLLFLFGGREQFEPAKIAAREWFGLLLFPFGVMIGFAVAWWKEGLGGGITVTSVLAFYLIYGWLLRGVTLGGWFLVFAFPALLFLACHVLSRSRRRTVSQS